MNVDPSLQGVIMQKYFHVILSSILPLLWKEPSLAEGYATEGYEMRVIEADHLNKVLKSRWS